MPISNSSRKAALARLRMGVAPENAGLSTEELEELRQQGSGEAESGEQTGEQASAGEQAGDAAAGEGEQAAAGDAPSEQAGDASAPQLQVLREELSEALKTNAKLEAQVENLQAQLSAADAGAASAKSVIQTCIERLAIGLGTTVVGLENLSLSGLCAQFGKMDEQFTKTFPVGARSKPAAASADDSQGTGAVSDAEFTRRVKAARTITKR